MSFAIIMILTVIFTSSNSAVKIEFENDRLLSCRALTSPDEYLEFEWLTNGTVIKNSSKFTITEDSTLQQKYTSTLAINHNVTVHDEAIYTCRMGNQSDSRKLYGK